MSAHDTRRAFIEFANELAKQENRASDLWTWLPSYKAAVRAHGDYAGEHRPSVADVMAEAAMYISHGLNPTLEQINEAGDFYKCPCGECGEGDDGEKACS